MKKFLAAVSFAVLLYPTLAAASVIVGPSAELLVNGVDSGIVFDWRTANNKVFTLDYGNTSGPLRELHVTGDIDPFINYSIAFVNPFSTTTTFTINVVMPYVGGPYDLLTISHSSTDSDGLRDGGNVGLDVEPHIANALLDGVVMTGLSTGCAITPSAVAETCFPATTSTVGVSSAAAGLFAVRVNFTLTPLDFYTAAGTVTLSSVPEPSTLFLIGAGVAALVRRRVVG